MLETIHLVMPNDLNPHDNLFGGTLMSWMDKIAAQCAMFITKCDCVTVSMDKMDFKAAVTKGDTVKLAANFVKRGNSSLQIYVRAIRLHPTSPAKEIGASVFTFVAMKDGKPYKDWRSPLFSLPQVGGSE